MIFEAIINVFVSLVSAVAALFPQIEPPAFLDSIAGHVATVAGYMAPVGYWVPFGAAGAATQAVVAACAAAVLIRFVRFVVSLLTGGGGG